MINLLPPEVKRQIRAARTNVILLRVTVLLTLVVVFMLSAFAAGFYITFREKQQADDFKAAQLDTSKNYSDARTRANAFATNLNAAKTILNSQISYTTLLIKLTNSLPPGTILNNINIADANFGKPITLSAGAKSYDAILRLKSALGDSGIIDSVGIISIQDSASGTTPVYPLQVTLSGQLTKKPPIISEGDIP